MKCFILAAGFGKRMEELTVDLPKPLLPVGGYPMLDYSIFFATGLGIREFIINTHYLSEKIEDYLKKYKTLTFHISKEKEILGTGGGIRTGIEGKIGMNENFLLLNPDLIFIPERKFLLEMPESGNFFLYLKERSGANQNTGLKLEKNKVKFVKENEKSEKSYYYIGLSVINSSAIYRNLAFENPYDLSLLFKELSYENKLEGREFSGSVYDLGTKEEYKKYLKLNPIPSEKKESWNRFQSNL